MESRPKEEIQQATPQWLQNVKIAGRLAYSAGMVVAALLVLMIVSGQYMLADDGHKRVSYLANQSMPLLTFLLPMLLIYVVATAVVIKLYDKQSRLRNLPTAIFMGMAAVMVGAVAIEAVYPSDHYSSMDFNGSHYRLAGQFDYLDPGSVLAKDEVLCRCTTWGLLCYCDTLVDNSLNASTPDRDTFALFVRGGNLWVRYPWEEAQILCADADANAKPFSECEDYVTSAPVETGPEVRR